MANGKRPEFLFCYEIVTEESAAAGDVSEHGIYEPGGYHYPMPADHFHLSRADLPQPAAWTRPGALRSFLEDCRALGMAWDGSTDWLYSSPETDYRSGDVTSYSAHVSHVTESTRRRILRLFARR